MSFLLPSSSSSSVRSRVPASQRVRKPKEALEENVNRPLATIGSSINNNENKTSNEGNDSSSVNNNKNVSDRIQYSVPWLKSFGFTAPCQQPPPNQVLEINDILLNRDNRDSYTHIHRDSRDYHNYNTVTDNESNDLSNHNHNNNEHNNNVNQTSSSGSSPSTSPSPSPSPSPSSLPLSLSVTNPPVATLRPLNTLRPGSGNPSANKIAPNPNIPNNVNTNNKRSHTHNQSSSSNNNNLSANNSSNPNRLSPSAPLDIDIKPLTLSASGYKVLKSVPADERLLRSLNAILNKLTPEKFDLLVQRVIDLDISKPSLLRDCVTAVFEKALAEPNFSPTYAEFCVRLINQLPSFPDESNPKHDITFKRLLLSMCQNEFETFQLVTDHNPNQGPDAQLEHDASVNKAKRRQLGMIRFIGELFVRGTLTSQIMRKCIELLLGNVNSPIEEDIESLGKLLTTVGFGLEKNVNLKPEQLISNKEFLNVVFEDLLVLSKSKKLSSRIRFMLQDIIELRLRGWISRRKEEKQIPLTTPKEKSADTPTKEKKSNAPNTNIPANVNPLVNQPSTRGLNKKGADRFAMFAENANANASNNSSEPQQPTHNILSNNNRSNNPSTSNSVNNNANNTNNNLNKFLSPETVSSASDESQRLKISSLLNELAMSNDIDEALHCIEELLDTKLVPCVLIFELMVAALEGSENDKDRLINSTVKLISLHRAMTSEAIYQAIAGLCFVLSDMVIDLPKAGDHFSRIIAQLIQRNIFSFYLFHSAIAYVNEAQDVIKLSVSVFENVRNLRGSDNQMISLLVESFSIVNEKKEKLGNWLQAVPFNQQKNFFISLLQKANLTALISLL